MQLPSAELIIGLLFQVTFCYIASLYFFQNSGKFALVNSRHTEIPDTLLTQIQERDIEKEEEGRRRNVLKPVKEAGGGVFSAHCTKFFLDE